MSLDHTNGHRVVDTLALYRVRGTVVVVTHDPEMVGDADEVLLLRDGLLADVQQPSELRTNTASARPVGASPSRR